MEVLFSACLKRITNEEGRRIKDPPFKTYAIVKHTGLSYFLVEECSEMLPPQSRLGLSNECRVEPAFKGQLCTIIRFIFTKGSGRPPQHFEAESVDMFETWFCWLRQAVEPDENYAMIILPLFSPFGLHGPVLVKFKQATMMIMKASDLHLVGVLQLVTMTAIGMDLCQDQVQAWFTLCRGCTSAKQLVNYRFIVMSKSHFADLLARIDEHGRATLRGTWQTWRLAMKWPGRTVYLTNHFAFCGNEEWDSPIQAAVVQQKLALIFSSHWPMITAKLNLTTPVEGRNEMDRVCLFLDWLSLYEPNYKLRKIIKVAFDSGLKYEANFGMWSVLGPFHQELSLKMTSTTGAEPLPAHEVLEAPPASRTTASRGSPTSDNSEDSMRRGTKLRCTPLEEVVILSGQTNLKQTKPPTSVSESPPLLATPSSPKASRTTGQRQPSTAPALSSTKKGKGGKALPPLKAQLSVPSPLSAPKSPTQKPKVIRASSGNHTYLEPIDNRTDAMDYATLRLLAEYIECNTPGNWRSLSYECGLTFEEVQELTESDIDDSERILKSLLIWKRLRSATPKMLVELLKRAQLAYACEFLLERIASSTASGTHEEHH